MPQGSILLERRVPDGVYLRHVDAGLVQVLHLPCHLLVRWYDRFLQQTLVSIINLCIKGLDLIVPSVDITKQI